MLVYPGVYNGVYAYYINIYVILYIYIICCTLYIYKTPYMYITIYIHINGIRISLPSELIRQINQQLEELSSHSPSEVRRDPTYFSPRNGGVFTSKNGDLYSMSMYESTSKTSEMYDEMYDDLTGNTGDLT